ncbi:unnamed protein product [Symbiodinium natans]|uniref:Uncharacterized protein n=1 Tax=Symbiodinium natans TaxID=878477 RepID=A0A812MHB2_9DINO|nr:unnamed protein product [Symbiodinium natans]
MHEMICQCLTSELRFNTDPTVPGTEMLAIAAALPHAGCKPPWPVAASEIQEDLRGLVAAQNIMMVKGWSRSVAAVTILRCAYECRQFREDLCSVQALRVDLRPVDASRLQPGFRV